MLKVNRRIFLWLAYTILFLILASLSGMVIKYYLDYQNIPSNHLIGNSVSNLKNSKEDGFPFSFLVIGDTRGSETAETLIEMALEKGTTSFMVILGDFVRKPDIWNHRFFLTEMTTEINLTFPVFLVPGNHEIDDTGKEIKQIDRRVTSEVYESLYGVKDFDFVFNNCLFIICDNASPRNRSSYLSLRGTLSKKGEGKRHIFVFMHCPPRGLAKHISGDIPDEEFFSLIETYKVTACFFGDYHGYWRGQRKGVNLIVSGGGGGDLEPSRWGAFHHILKVTVWQDKVSEEIISINSLSSMEDRFEEWVFTHLLPIIRDRVWILYFLVFLFLPWGIYCAIRFLISLRR